MKASRSAVLACALAALGCGSKESGLPSSLPFQLERPGLEPLPREEAEAFARTMADFFERVHYFAWVRDVSHGMDASTGKPDYLLWWDDVQAVKEGDTVTFRHSTTGGGHNIYGPSSKVLEAAAAGYLFTGDATMGELA